MFEEVEWRVERAIYRREGRNVAIEM